MELLQIERKPTFLANSTACAQFQIPRLSLCPDLRRKTLYIYIYITGAHRTAKGARVSCDQPRTLNSQPIAGHTKHSRRTSKASAIRRVEPLLMITWTTTRPACAGNPQKQLSYAGKSRIAEQQKAFLEALRHLPRAFRVQCLVGSNLIQKPWLLIFRFWTGKCSSPKNKNWIYNIPHDCISLTLLCHGAKDLNRKRTQAKKLSKAGVARGEVELAEINISSLCPANYCFHLSIQFCQFLVAGLLSVF